MTSDEKVKILNVLLNMSKDEESGEVELWLNDTFAWACSDCFTVKDCEIDELYRLVKKYGFCGAAYWAGKKDGIRSAFEDINRYIDFVTHEENLIKELPSSDARAGYKLQYTLGSKP